MKLTKTATKITTGLLIFALTLALTACSSKPKDTPVRVGKGISSVSLSHVPETIEEIIEGTDLIIDVTVTEWLDENLDVRYTLFSATVNNVIKGDLSAGDEITFRQRGTSQSTMYEFPLYKIGDRILLFLCLPSQHDIDNLLKPRGHEESYVMQCVYMFAYDIWEHDNELYVLDRLGYANRYFNPGESKRIENIDSDLTEIVIREFLNSDSIIKEMVEKPNSNMYLYSFKYNDMVKKIIEIDNENQNGDYLNKNQGKRRL
ncbi:MAG: hypothetical protein FWD34_04950 [Oscillospiraceae bacterium]|nr:hypothetical protein [Oscillospiraceae bacterium]